MFAIFLPLILFVPVLGVETNDADSVLMTILENVVQNLVPIGQPMTEDMAQLKAHCNNLDNTLMSKYANMIKLYLQGVLAKAIQNLINNMQTDKIYVCQLLKKGESDKVLKMVKEVNHHLPEANIIRISFLAAVHQAVHKNPKITIPDIACLVKQLNEKLLAIYPEKDGAKELMKELLGISLDIYISTLEAEKGKAADSCPMPTVATNPFPFQSVLLAVGKAIVVAEEIKI